MRFITGERGGRVAVWVAATLALVSPQGGPPGHAAAAHEQALATPTVAAGRPVPKPAPAARSAATSSSRPGSRVDAESTDSRSEPRGRTVRHPDHGSHRARLHARHHHARHHHARHHHARHRHARHHHARHHHARQHRHSDLPDNHARALAAARHARWLARPEVSAGRDISWPQCPPGVGMPGLTGFGAPMPGPHVRFVVIGLTNGRGFTRNHCLDMHLRWAKRHHAWAAAYAMSTYPTRAQIARHGRHGPYRHRSYRGRLGNAAFAAARFNIATMRRHHFPAPHVWLDIEPSSTRPWHGRADNRMVVLAWVRAYRQAGYRVGFYSTPYLWHGIVGDLRLGLPEWRTAGPAPARSALGKCRTDQFQGGRAILAQWWTSSRDFDRVCPGFQGARTMERFFHKY